MVNEVPTDLFDEDECSPMWFKVQICVSKERAAAERLARRLRDDGYNAYVIADDQS